MISIGGDMNGKRYLVTISFSDVIVAEDQHEAISIARNYMKSSVKETDFNFEIQRIDIGKFGDIQ